MFYLLVIRAVAFTLRFICAFSCPFTCMCMFVSMFICIRTFMFRVMLPHIPICMYVYLRVYVCVYI